MARNANLVCMLVAVSGLDLDLRLHLTAKAGQVPSKASYTFVVATVNLWVQKGQQH